jgi:threonine dehydrogenase-like Zn-dependent dehydrogenase
VLVIGAGPIGLVHAWGMKYLNPELNQEKLSIVNNDQQANLAAGSR